jgi:hypothetical protein
MATENVNHANNIIETETEGIPSSGKYNFSLSCSMQFPLATRLPTTNHGMSSCQRDVEIVWGNDCCMGKVVLLVALAIITYLNNFKCFSAIYTSN